MWNIKNQFAFLFLGLIVFNFNNADAASFSLQGRIEASDFTPLESSSVNFTVKIYSPGSEACLLYQETHVLNMSGSKGVFALSIGAGSRSGTGFENTSTIEQAVSNLSTNVMSPVTCSSGTSYTPAAGDKRKLRLSFDEGAGPITLASDHIIESVPYAMYAESLQGKSESDFIQVNTATGHVLSQTNMDWLFQSAKYSELQALINGTSTQYVLSSAASSPNFNNYRLTNVGDPTSGTDATNKNYVDQNVGGNAINTGTLIIGDVGKVLTWDGSKWVATATAADTTKLPLAGGTMSGGINMGNQSISNAYDVSLNNNLTVSGGIGVTNGINSNGDVALLNQKDVRFGDSGTNYVAIQAPATVASNITWTLPGTNGSSGQVLSNNGSGVLSWLTLPAAGTASGDFVANSSVPHCNADEKLQITAGPTYTWSCVPVIRDADFNTRIRVEANANEDKIRFDTAGTERMIIDNAGNVGIGTNNPNSPLTINGNVRALNGAQLILMDVGSTAGVALMSPATNNLALYTGATERMRVDASGNVGINSTSPTAKLDVVGTVKATAFSGDGSALTNISGSSLTTGSVNSTHIFNGTILDIDISGSAAIARNKVASGSVNRVVVNDASGVMTDAAAITANMALISDANGIPTHSATVSSTELGYLDNVTSAIQTQLNGKQATLVAGDITSTLISNGTILDADINAAAGIVDTKLATISTAGKVSNSATTATSANTVSAIVARDASGNFSAGTITANLSGNATTATTATTANGVAWTNVTGRPTAVSSFTNDSGYVTSAGSVNYATSSGNADTTDGYHMNQDVRTTAAPSFAGLNISNAYSQVFNGTYDVWLQGSFGGAGSARNLALLGVTGSDTLYVNYSSEYAGGTVIGGPVSITGATSVSGAVSTSSAVTHGVLGVTTIGTSGAYGVYGQSGSYYGALGRADGYSFVGSGSLYNNGDIIAASGGNMYATDYYYTSDRRFKKDIRTIANSLDLVSELRGVEFTWKKNNEKDIGFIAQEVEAVVPDLVKERNDQQLGNYKSVKYANIVAIVVEAVKELKNKFLGLDKDLAEIKLELSKVQNERDILKSQVDQMKNDMENINKRLSEIEKQKK